MYRSVAWEVNLGESTFKIVPRRRVDIIIEEPQWAAGSRFTRLWTWPCLQVSLSEVWGSSVACDLSPRFPSSHPNRSQHHTSLGLWKSPLIWTLFWLLHLLVRGTIKCITQAYNFASENVPLMMTHNNSHTLEPSLANQGIWTHNF